MKTTSEEKISDLVQEHIVKSISLGGRLSKIEAMELSYREGFKACEANMLESAESLFEDWHNKTYFQIRKEDNRELASIFTEARYNQKQAFTAGAMSQAKTIDALEKEQVKHIEIIQDAYNKRIKELEEALRFYASYENWNHAHEEPVFLGVDIGGKAYAVAQEALKQGGEK
jgi:hypothetical protein